MDDQHIDDAFAGHVHASTQVEVAQPCRLGDGGQGAVRDTGVSHVEMGQLGQMGE